MTYAHLNAHSCYSLLEGLPLPEELAAAAQKDGLPALALTDHNLLTGTVPFYQACQRAGIQPILGLEVDLGNICHDESFLVPGSLARS